DRVLEAIDHQEVDELLAPLARGVEVALAGNRRKIESFDRNRVRHRMLLTIRTNHQPATELGFLLHKHPDRVHTREFPFGMATVFYPEASEEACTAVIMLDLDPVGMVRGRPASSPASGGGERPGRGRSGIEDQYVNDRPYVASSLLSVVLTR